MPDTELKTSHIKDKVTKVVQCSDLMKCSNYLGIKIYKINSHNSLERGLT